MQSKAKTVQEYLDSLPEDRKEAMHALRNAITKNIPKGFTECMGYGMMGWAVPHSIYPAGYHCDSSQPLPVVSMASQKNSINFYHMGIYADPKLLKWFVTEFPKHTQQRLDMGKSCIRFKKFDTIPVKLIGELMKKISVKEWIQTYESNFKNPKADRSAKEKEKPKTVSVRENFDRK
jgi:hypothetical protein